MYQENYTESFGQNAPPLGAAFDHAHGAAYDKPQDISSESGVETSSDQGHMSDRDSHNLGPEQNSKITRSLAEIESLINSNDYTGAAEEILRINIGSLPLSVLERYTDALEQTASGLYDKDTYLNAQLATQSLAVAAVCDVIEESIAFNFFGSDDSVTVGSLDIEIPTPDANGDGLPILVWNDTDRESPSDNPQDSHNTGVLSRFMANETTSNYRAAGMDHGGAAGQHVFSLDLKMG